MRGAVGIPPALVVRVGQGGALDHGATHAQGCGARFEVIDCTTLVVLEHPMGRGLVGPALPIGLLARRTAG